MTDIRLQSHRNLPDPELTGPVDSGFDEFRFYRFGLMLGFVNLIRNGFRIGFKKTVGKITQPINSYTRFPEYFLMEQALQQHIAANGKLNDLRILDVGSPKTFGLYLAYNMRAYIEMTDISGLNLDDYKVLWENIKKNAKGAACFSPQDARALSYESAQFDVTYAMSVVEHVEGQEGDVRAIREMIRVLKPGGLLILSVPFGNRYFEQWRRGFAGAVQDLGDNNLYFFQRIYDSRALDKRITKSFNDMRVCGQWTIWRTRHLPGQCLAQLRTVGSLLGFVNPWLSVWLNRCSGRILQTIPCCYGAIHSRSDYYGDVVLCAVKG